MAEPLDRPVWSSLTTLHDDLGEVDGPARRYRPDVNIFVTAEDCSPAARGAMARLVAPGEKVIVLHEDGTLELPGLALEMARPLVQMVFDAPPPAPEAGSDPAIHELGEDDAEEMVALAALTRPGPFLRNTRLMGRYVGIRREGRLAAMAGERMRFPGHCEMSAVCTHPDFQGQGLGRLFSNHVTAEILRRGEQPFLHAYADNAPAIGLYEKLGYRVRRRSVVMLFAKGELA